MGDAMARLAPANAVLMVVDYQERLLPAIDAAEACVAAGRRMIEAADVLEVPLVATEQYPAGLGPTCPAIREALGGTQIVEKARFSGCVDAVMKRLAELNRRLVIVVGIEAHVCVQQTVLDLLREGYLPYVCADAVGSRRPVDRETALGRMRQAGAIITTTESAIFELLGEAGTERFRKVLRIVK
jgi:nicotinamidase-related amidase